MIKRRSNGFEIFPVTNAWEFRRFKEHRGGAADGEIADKSLKESRPSGIAKFKKEGAFQKSEKEQLAEQLREQGVKVSNAVACGFCAPALTLECTARAARRLGTCAG